MHEKPFHTVFSTFDTLISDDLGIQCVSVLQCVAVCCSMLQCIAVCCSALQCVAVCCNVHEKPFHTVFSTFDTLISDDLGCVCVSVLQCVAVCLD